MPLDDLSLAKENDWSALPELDYLLCRNVEIFNASDEDVQDHTYLEGSCNTVVVGQVGLRCKHCSLSPFATARYATVFPSSIDNIGAGLRVMAEWHFSRCCMTPGNVREGIKRVLSIMQKTKENGREYDDSMMPLNEFCSSVVAKRFDLQNLLPRDTGIIFSNSEREERLRETSKQLPFPVSNPRWFGAEETFSAASHHHSQRYSSSTRYNFSHAQHRPPDSPSPQSKDAVPHNAPIPRPPPVSMDRCMPVSQLSIPPSQPDYLQSFTCESMGWSCRHCSSVPFQFRAPNSFYPYNAPPTPSFVEYHLQSCTGTTFYQSSNQESCPEPAMPNLDAALQYLDSVSHEDSLLVLDEDRVLLSDYFFYLIKQLQCCRFAESDRKIRGGKRDNVKVGFGGFECRHCANFNPATPRKFFWSNVDRLANSFTEIPSHMLNCKNCPQRIKKALHVLKIKHPEQIVMLPRGSQKVFFRRMWRRLHVDSATEYGKESTQVHSTTVAPSTPTYTLPNSKIPLATQEDRDWLSDTDCFVRRNLEVFCASHDDLISSQTDRKFPIALGQVGIRCLHCATSPDGASGNAVSFPHSIDGIYEVVKELSKSHLESCRNVPANVSQEMENLKTTTSLSSVSKRYHSLAARSLGMMDASEGIRMGDEKLSIASTGDLIFKNIQDKESTELSPSVKDSIKENTLQKRKASTLPEDIKDFKKQNTL